VDGETYTVTSGKRSCIKPISCKECPLAHNLKIEPDLSSYKRVLLIGESPGRGERILMKPFTGPSGQLLRSVLDDTGASTFGVGFSNTILCEGVKDLDENFLGSALDYCSDRLWKEIDDLKPELIVAAGGMAKDLLLPDIRKGVSSISGELFIQDGLNILPILHPAHILRFNRLYESFWDQVNEIRLFFTQKPGPFEVKFGNLNSIEYLSSCSEIALDVETTSYTPHDTGPGITWNGRTYTRGRLLSLSLNGDGKTSYIFTPLTFKKYKQQLKLLLESKFIICHNGQFDIPFLNKEGIFPKLANDTMLMSYSMDESPRHPLKRLSRRYLGLEDWSAALNPYIPTTDISYAAVPPRTLYKYNGMDTSATFNLKKVLESKMEKSDFSIYRTVLIPCANMFISTNVRGIRIDIGKLMSLKHSWEKERLMLLNKLKKFGVINPNSPFQISDALQDLGVTDYDAVTLKRNLEKLIPECRARDNTGGIDFINLVIAYREIDKALNTFLREVAISTSLLDLRVHPDFKLFGTVTGRLTAASPSLLNYPKSTRFSDELRTLFIPEPGYVWGHWDQKNFELRVYAVVNDDKKMKEIFAAGRDPHAEVGHLVYGNDYERLNRETLGYTRTAIKAVVFGKMYGRGDASVASQIGWSLEDAEDLGRKIEAMFPGIQVYRDKILNELNENQELVNPLGRRRRFPIITNDNYHEVKNEAFNFPIQSTASDLNLLGMLKLHELNDPDLIPLFPIHDSIEFQIRESRIPALESLITETLSEIPKTVLDVRDVKFETDRRMGDNWSEATIESKISGE